MRQHLCIIGSKLNDANIDGLVFLLQDYIPVKERYRKFEFLEVLIDKEIVTKTSWLKLKTKLCVIKRYDLVDLIVEFEKNSSFLESQDVPSSIKTPHKHGFHFVQKLKDDEFITPDKMRKFFLHLQEVGELELAELIKEYWSSKIVRDLSKNKDKQEDRGPIPLKLSELLLYKIEVKTEAPEFILELDKDKRFPDGIESNKEEEKQQTGFGFVQDTELQLDGIVSINSVPQSRLLKKNDHFDDFFGIERNKIMLQNRAARNIFHRTSLEMEELFQTQPDCGTDESEKDNAEICASEIDASELDDSEIDASAIDASEIDASEIDDSEIDASEIDGFAIDASEIDGFAIDASEIDDSESKESVFPKLYSMSNNPCGICIIFNNKFEGGVILKERRGTDRDAKRLEILFEWLGFYVEICNSYSADQMKKKLKEAANDAGNRNLDCFVTFILSHGKKGAVYGNDGNAISITKLESYFAGDKCRSLINKPKIIFIQACQGDKYGTAVYISEDDFSATEEPTIEHDGASRSTHADILVYSSTITGYKSYRDRITGSLFIQTLCAVFESDAGRLRFYDLMLKVNKVVSEQMLIMKDKSGKKRCAFQISSAKELTLTKGIQFKPKSRDFNEFKKNYPKPTCTLIDLG